LDKAADEELARSAVAGNLHPHGKNALDPLGHPLFDPA
jgi:hypothetical protein